MLPIYLNYYIGMWQAPGQPGEWSSVQHSRGGPLDSRGGCQGARTEPRGSMKDLAAVCRARTGARESCGHHSQLEFTRADTLNEQFRSKLNKGVSTHSRFRRCTCTRARLLVLTLLVVLNLLGQSQCQSHIHYCGPRQRRRRRRSLPSSGCRRQ